MKKLAFFLLLLAAPASAQSRFVPFTVTEADVQQLQQFFRYNTPPAYSEPVVQWLSTMEQKAQAKEAAKHQSTAPAPAPATPAAPASSNP